MGRNFLCQGPWEEKAVITSGGALFQRQYLLFNHLLVLSLLLSLLLLVDLSVLNDEWKKMRDFELSEWSPGSSNKVTLVNALNNLLIAELDDSMSGLIWLDLIYMMPSA